MDIKASYQITKDPQRELFCVLGTFRRYYTDNEVLFIPSHNYIPKDTDSGPLTDPDGCIIGLLDNTKVYFWGYNTKNNIKPNTIRELRNSNIEYKVMIPCWQ